jgi:N-acetylneuraminic acid mutarotase
LVWGGLDATLKPLSVGRFYEVSSNSWKNIANTGPQATAGISAVWVNGHLFTFGGRDSKSLPTNDTYSYNSTNNSWSKLSVTNAPAARSDAFCIWTGSAFLVWGGKDASNAPIGDGALFDPAKNSWTSLPATTFAARSAGLFESGWTALWGSSVFLFGGQGAASDYQDTARFDTSVSQWSVLPSWLPASEHRGAMGAWTGKEFVVWSGFDGSTLSDGGSRWLAQ